MTTAHTKKNTTVQEPEQHRTSTITHAKVPNTVGYYSAYYRGLQCLLENIWPLVRAEVPDATLDVYYGWESWVGMQGKNDFYYKMEDLFEKMKAEGVTVHGRVSHTELAEAMKSIKVWAYPTEFEEIHCITALKAQEAGCYPVTTNVGALKETVQSGTKIATRRIYTDTYKQGKFAEAVIAALKERRTGEPTRGTDWMDVAERWSSVIKQEAEKTTKSREEQAIH